MGLQIPRNKFEIANLEQQMKTLQGIGLSGSYWYKDAYYPFKENPWRVIQGIANPIDSSFDIAPDFYRESNSGGEMEVVCGDTDHGNKLKNFECRTPNDE